MPTYDEISESLGKSLSEDQLTKLIRECYRLAATPTITNVAVPFFLAGIFSSIKTRWFESSPLSNELATVLDGRLIPTIKALLESVRGPSRPEVVLSRMNHVVQAYYRCCRAFGS